MLRSILIAAAIGGVVLFAPGNTSAHSGGLNAEGCHNNRKTGDYHCHRAQSFGAAPARAPALQAPYRSNLKGTQGSTGRAYANCSAARADGAAPVRRGDPGYGSHLDRDGDGIGCE